MDNPLDDYAKKKLREKQAIGKIIESCEKLKGHLVVLSETEKNPEKTKMCESLIADLENIIEKLSSVFNFAKTTPAIINVIVLEYVLGDIGKLDLPHFGGVNCYHYKAAAMKLLQEFVTMKSY